jgi:ligand-binding SRPBCC domain-containing protein
VRSRRSTSSGSGGRSASGPELSAHRDEGDPGRAREERGVRCIERAQVVPLALDDAFAFFADAANLEAITPPWLRFRILTPRPIELREGALIEYRLTLHRVPVRWLTRIDRWSPGVCFVDRQVEGPFALWEHTHTFEDWDRATLIRDRVVYRMPLRAFGALAHRLVIGRDLQRIFDYRHEATAGLLDPATSVG